MKPIWIVDDDQSIRFVLEKALLRENLPTRSFTHPQEVLKALAYMHKNGGIHRDVKVRRRPRCLLGPALPTGHTLPC